MARRSQVDGNAQPTVIDVGVTAKVFDDFAALGCTAVWAEAKVVC